MKYKEIIEQAECLKTTLQDLNTSINYLVDEYNNEESYSVKLLVRERNRLARELKEFEETEEL